MALDYVHYFELIGITFQNSGGSKGAIPSHAPSLSPSFFHFHAVFGKNFAK